MSNLSDIGFPVRNETDINDMLMQVLGHVSEIRCAGGFYLKFSDASGAELYLQGNADQELIGFNPHYAGKSRRTVSLTAAIDRDSSELDGGFHAWANPSGEAGDYPFVFNSPDFKTLADLSLPHLAEIQLTAFASNDFEIYADEREFAENQPSAVKLAAKSFVSTGLFAGGETAQTDLSVVHPIAAFAGEVKDSELKINALTGGRFYALLVETLGGEIDVAADEKLFPAAPVKGSIVSGQFWLSGRVRERLS